ncbi:hypothetical protein M569_07329 [Genlisea aurea]|uniref:Bifunctional inhibitor/plant lipid transfer protein/seed storage helical domain-containing protein n=1 Tax=Genlisea aurea TaxID=192259 RepID=S8CRH4_9LAMI|nr:hypothetical protein M569_07329 [Genlisea aurea]
MKIEASILVAILVFEFVVSAAKGQEVCSLTVGELMECRPAATPPKPENPSAACCKALKHADFKCLCNYLDNPVLPSLNIDPKLALQIPKKCGLPTPQC